MRLILAFLSLVLAVSLSLPPDLAAKVPASSKKGRASYKMSTKKSKG
jgi:hypothetical protein